MRSSKNGGPSCYASGTESELVTAVIVCMNRKVGAAERQNKAVTFQKQQAAISSLLKEEEKQLKTLSREPDHQPHNTGGK